MSLISFICNFKKCVLVFKRNGRRDRATFKTEKRAQNGEERESWTHLLPRTHRMYSYIWKNFLWKKKASQRAERLLRSWQRRGGAHRMKLVSLQQENAESVSPLKMSRNFSGYDNTVDRERELCVSNTGDAVSGKEHSTRRRHSPHLHTTNNMSQNQLKSNDPFRRKRARFLNW